tara:strand:+ start:2798 stop:4864 length:2067 start_codon:yes stop_codon:yes gene_type:complete
MPDIRVNDKVVDRLKTGFVLTPKDKKGKWEDLLDNQPLFRNLAAYVFNSVSDTPNMQKVRRVTRNLITLDDSDYKGTDLYFDEEEYDEYLQSFLSVIEKAPLSKLVLELQGMGYIQPDGKNRAFSEGLRDVMDDQNTRLIDLGNDLKVSKLLGDRYGKGLDDTDRKTKPAQEKAKDKYISRSSRLLGAFDRSEPVLYPSTLQEFLSTTGTDITIDTEGYFTKLFKVEGYGTLGEDSFQFNSIKGKNLSVKEIAEQKKTQKEKEAEEEEAYQAEMDREVAEGMEEEEDDDAGITQKMLRKAETKGSNKLVSLKILGNGRYELNSFGKKEAFNTDNRSENLEELWESLQDISLPNEKELIEIVRSQRKSGLKDAILGALTPQSNKIDLGQVSITLKMREWEDEEAFILWAVKGGGKDEDKKLTSAVKNMTKRTLMLKSLFDDLESNWGSYVYDKNEAPFDRFIQVLSEKKRKELLAFFSMLIINIKQDNLNLQEDNEIEEIQYENIDFINPKTEKTEQKIIPKKDKDGKQVIENKPYYPAFGNHTTFITKIEAILKNIKSGDYRESVNIIPLLAEADDTDGLMSTIKEQLEESQDWKREGDVEFKVSDTEGIPILTFSRKIKVTSQVDTNIGRRTSGGKDRFKTGRFSERGIGASDKQIENRTTLTDSNDADELRLVYTEYEGLKEMIER